MRISHNPASLNIYRQLISNNAQGAKSLEQLSAGLRIDKSGAAAAGLSISEQMRIRLKDLNGVSDSAQERVTTIQTAQNGLDAIGNSINQLRDLAVRATNGNLTSDVREAIQKQYEGLTQQIDKKANSTTFNAQQLLNGEGRIAVGQDAAASEISGLVKTDEHGATSVAIGDFRAAALGITGLDFSTAQGATDALKKIGSADQKVDGQLQNLRKVDRYFIAGVARENRASSDSRIRDVDMAQEMLEFTKTNILNQAATAMLAQANQGSPAVLQLLR